MKRLGKVGLALGGGGAKGLAHVGALKVLEENNIPIHKIAGTSMGAIIGVLYCAGHSADSIIEILNNEKVWNGFKLSIFNGGLVSHSGVKQTLKKYINHDEFDKLKIPFYVTASNLNTGKLKVVSEGKHLLDWVLASSSIPVAFTPTRIDGATYADGGIFMNLPAEPLMLNCDTVIGSNVVPDASVENISSARSVAERVFNLSIIQNVRNSKRYCDYFIEPRELRKYSMWDFKKMNEIIEMGYNAAEETVKKNLLPDLKEELLPLKK